MADAGNPTPTYTANGTVANLLSGLTGSMSISTCDRCNALVATTVQTAHTAWHLSIRQRLFEPPPTMPT